MALPLGSLFVWLAIRQFKINRKRITEGVIVMARVIRIVEYPRQRFGPYYRPVVEFVNRQGKIISSEVENSEKPQYTIGEEIEVIYHPDKPNEVTTTAGFANNVAPMTFMIAGVVLLLFFIFNILH